MYFIDDDDFICGFGWGKLQMVDQFGRFTYVPLTSPSQIKLVGDAQHIQFNVIIAGDIFRKYLTPEIPLAASEMRGDARTTIDGMIDAAIESMYSLSEENRFLEVTYANGDKEVLYFKDFASGAMIESVVRRAKKLALKRYIGGGPKGVATDDMILAVREEFKENEDLPNTTNPDDWAKIAGKKGERIVYVKPLMGETKEKQRSVEKIVNTGQYL